MSRRTVHFFSRCCALCTLLVLSKSFFVPTNPVKVAFICTLYNVDFFYDYWQTGPGVDRVVRRLKVMMKIQKQIFVGKQCTFFSKTHIKKRPILRQFFSDFCQFPINFSCTYFVFISIMDLWLTIKHIPLFNFAT